MSDMIEHAKTLERTGLTRQQAEALVQCVMSMIKAEVDALEARLALKFDAMEKQLQVLRFNIIAGNAALVIGLVSIVIALLVK